MLDRIRREIVALCHAGLDSEMFRRRVLKALRRAVPVDAAWWATVGGNLGSAA